ncbi:TNF receptor-associated factor 4-like isoform X1 [Dysidea avara]|uniref:TNF receptor-associated factor 4-like isoform X1 n=2 Tax=Dysidea avara TaxID=196820 RepID=UPI00332CBE93
MAIATPTDHEIGGYEHKFVDTPHDRYICKICHHPSRDPYLSVCCGFVFCKSCLDNVRKVTSTCTIIYACPICRADKEFVTFPNKQLDREVKSLHVMCTNEERGCEWQGELNDINNHLGNGAGCQFGDVKCSNECGKMLQQRYLTSHVEIECPCRKVDCQYCHITGEYQFIEGEHKEQCPKLPLPCPNKCGIGSVPREGMEAHRKECPLEMVWCLHKCRKRLQRQHLPNHFENECPRHVVKCHYCHTVKERQFIEGPKHFDLCPKLPLPCPNKCKVGNVPREDMKEHRKECPLEMVECKYLDVGCEERMMRKDLEKHKNEKMEKHLSLTESKLADTTSQLSVALNELTLYKFNDGISSERALSSVKHSIKLQAMAVMVKSGDQVCPVIVNITEFSKQVADKVQKNTSCFFSHDKGYKMCLRAYPAGNGKGTHLSVYLQLMKGPHDDELTWPLRGKFEIKLLNQIHGCEHYSRTVTYDDRTEDDTAGRVTVSNTAGWGYHEFIFNEDLQKVTPTCQYLKDDCIFFQVSKL